MIEAALKPLPPLDFTIRLEAPELLDLGAGDEEDVATNLLEMARINRHFGGVGMITRHLHRLIAPRGDPATLLDLGTGSGEMLRMISAWALRTQRHVRLVGLDRAGRNLAVARAQGDSSPFITLLQADAARMPLPDESVDIILSSLFLHHFNPHEVVELLRFSYSKARRGLLMNDLVRGRLPYMAFRLIQPVFAQHPMTRYDGALSIRRAYNPAELYALAMEAGLRGFKIYSHWPWRMTLVALKGTSV